MKKLIALLLISVFADASAQPCIPNTNAIDFDGFSSYISISPQTGFGLSAAVTVEAWIKPSSFGFNSAQNSIVCKHGWSSGEGGYVLRCGGNGELSFNLAGIDSMGFPTSWVEVISNSNALSLNTWTHVAGTFDGSQLSCFVNGSLAASTPFAGTMASSSAYPLTIGSLSDPVWGPDRYFSGAIDEVRIWNRALSQTEIQAGMNNHIDPNSVSGLISNWRMNEAVGATIFDVAGTNNGSLAFCTWDLSVPFNAVPASPLITYSGDTLYSSASSGNQWYLDGTLVPGATETFYIPLQNGNYTVVVTSPEGCTGQSAGYLVNDVRVMQWETESFSIVYPNPVQYEIIFIVGSQAALRSQPVSLRICDATGRIVFSEPAISLSGDRVRIPVEDRFSAGTYFYELSRPDGKAAYGRFLVL